LRCQPLYVEPKLACGATLAAGVASPFPVARVQLACQLNQAAGPAATAFLYSLLPLLHGTLLDLPAAVERGLQRKWEFIPSERLRRQLGQ
jgi:hypothetical protein